MLESRRVLELGNRVHWYILWLNVGVFLFYNLGLIYDINSEYMMFVSRILAMFLLFAIVFGIWITVYSIAIYFNDKIFPTRIVIINTLRVLLVVIIAYINYHH